MNSQWEKLVTPKRSRQQIINYFCRRWRLIFQRYFCSRCSRCTELSLSLSCLLSLSSSFYSFVLFYRHLLYCILKPFSLFGRYFRVYVYGKINDMIKPFLLCTHNAPICYSFHFMYVSLYKIEWRRLLLRLEFVFEWHCILFDFFSSFSIFFSLVFSHSHFLLLSFSPHQRVNWMFVSQWKKNQFNIQFILIHVWFVFVTHFLNIYAHFMMLCATPFRAHCSFSMMQWLIARSLTRINSLHVLFRPFYHFISIIITSCA